MNKNRIGIIIISIVSALMVVGIILSISNRWTVPTVYANKEDAASSLVDGTLAGVRMKQGRKAPVFTPREVKVVEQNWQSLVNSPEESKALAEKAKALTMQKAKELEEGKVPDYSLSSQKKGAVAINKPDPEPAVATLSQPSEPDVEPQNTNVQVEPVKIEAPPENYLNVEEDGAILGTGVKTAEAVEPVVAPAPTQIAQAQTPTKPVPVTGGNGRVSYEEQKKLLENPDSFNDLGTYEMTAYDLSVTCCSKPRTDPGFGITATGFNLTGMSREDAMTVAVDPSLIPLGSRLLISFPAPYENFTGVYTARDTGSAIKGKIIDLYMGDFGTELSVQETKNFGRRYVQIYLLGG